MTQICFSGVREKFLESYLTDFQPDLMYVCIYTEFNVYIYRREQRRKLFGKGYLLEMGI